MTLEEAAAAVGLKRSSIYFYLEKLHIERKQFSNNRHVWIARTDVERIKAVREKPWTLEDEDDTGKREAIKPAA